jgi:hypothetical protein
MNTRKNTKGPAYYVQMAKGSTVTAAQSGQGDDLPHKNVTLTHVVKAE